MDCLKKHFRHLAFALCHQVRLKEVRMWQIISVLEAYPAPVTQNRYCLLVGWKNLQALIRVQLGRASWLIKAAAAYINIPVSSLIYIIVRIGNLYMVTVR